MKFCFSTLLLLFFSLFTLALALPVPLPTGGRGGQGGGGGRAGGNAAKGGAQRGGAGAAGTGTATGTGTGTAKGGAAGGAAAGGATGAATGGACSAAVNALAAGIQSNIADQQNEASTANKLATILAATPIDAAAFSSAKSQLLGFVNKGISIRENNQKIAPAGNGAIAGLAIVANAQAQELALSQSLTGTAKDVATVNTLKSDFAGGIAQNQKNLAAAKSGCA